MVLAFLPPGRDEEVKGPTQLQLQPYPGPLKYQYLTAWLTMAASELGYACSLSTLVVVKF